MFYSDFYDASAERKNGHGVQIVFVSSDESKDAALNHLREHHGDWLMLDWNEAISLFVSQKPRFRQAR